METGGQFLEAEVSDIEDGEESKVAVPNKTDLKGARPGGLNNGADSQPGQQ